LEAETLVFDDFAFILTLSTSKHNGKRLKHQETNFAMIQKCSCGGFDQ